MKIIGDLRLGTVTVTDLTEATDYIAELERDLDGARFAARMHLETVRAQAHVIAGMAPASSSVPEEWKKTLVDAARKLKTYNGIYTGDKEATRLVAELTAIAAAPVPPVATVQDGDFKSNSKPWKKAVTNWMGENDVVLSEQTYRTLMALPAAQSAPVDNDNQREQAKAWFAVAAALDQVSPRWMDCEDSGLAAAVTTIKRLAAQSAQGADATPDGWVLRRAVPHEDTYTDENDLILQKASECGFAYDGMGEFMANPDEVIAFGKAMAVPIAAQEPEEIDPGKERSAYCVFFNLAHDYFDQKPNGAHELKHSHSFDYWLAGVVDHRRRYPCTTPPAPQAVAAPAFWRCSACGKLTPPDSIHTCTPPEPSAAELVAAAQSKPTPPDTVDTPEFSELLGLACFHYVDMEHVFANSRAALIEYLNAWHTDGIATARNEQNMMAECMDMVRNDLIEAGVIDRSVPPMMVSDAVCSHIAKLEAVRQDKTLSNSQLRIFYMRDNQTFRELSEDEARFIAVLQMEHDDGGSYGMLVARRGDKRICDVLHEGKKADHAKFLEKATAWLSEVLAAQEQP